MNSSDHFINAAIIGVPFDFDRRTTIEFDRNHGEWFVGGDSGFRFVDAYYNIVKARERATEHLV